MLAVVVLVVWHVARALTHYDNEFSLGKVWVGSPKKKEAMNENASLTLPEACIPFRTDNFGYIIN